MDFEKLVHEKKKAALELDRLQFSYDGLANKLIMDTLEFFNGQKSNEIRKAKIEFNLSNNQTLFAVARSLQSAKRDFQEASDLLEVSIIMAKLKIAELQKV